MKRLLALTFSFILLFSVSIYAHPGRTDAYGGHKDKNNVSGLGPYHYHCGGYPAHLHANGICPYATSLNNTEENKVKNNNNKPEQTISQFDNISVIRNKNKILVNGVKLESDNYIFEDKTYIPIKDIITLLDADIKFDKDTFTTTITTH